VYASSNLYSTMPVITLTPGQAVMLYSWTRPMLTLRWSDIVANEHITWDLLKRVGLTSSQLYSIQPDGKQWVLHAQINLGHLRDMLPTWKIHPIKDMSADLADIISMKWPSETMRALGITFDDLIQVGLNPANMTLFGFTLMSWMTVEMYSRHVEEMSDVQVHHVFGMTKQAALSCLRNPR
jgi:hypothetical protein